MFKTISAALLVASVMAAPAFAGGHVTTRHAPAIKHVQVKAVHVRPSVLNANARMGHHHHHHRHVHHHGFHGHR